MLGTLPSVLPILSGSGAQPSDFLGCGSGGAEDFEGPECNACSPPQASPAALAKYVLAEVPRQVVEYYSHKELPPRGFGTQAREAGPSTAS